MCAFITLDVGSSNMNNITCHDVTVTLIKINPFLHQCHCFVAVIKSRISMNGS